MKFVLFVEGHTEHLARWQQFLKGWLDTQLEQPDRSYRQCGLKAGQNW